jgi:hypothetical protein
LNYEDVVSALTAKCQIQAQEIDSLKAEINSLKAGLQHYKLSLDNIPHQYTWDEANKQFRVDL